MKVEEAIRRDGELRSERVNWANYWQDLANFCLPRKAYVTTGPHQGQHLNYSQIYDGTAIRSLRTMASGFHSHLTNPASKWFSLETDNKTLMEDRAVKVWFKQSEDEMFTTLNNSNFDPVMQEYYQEGGCFGTAHIFTEEDPVKKVRFTSLPIGEVTFEEDANGIVNRIYRKFQYTVMQAWERWRERAGEIVTQAIKDKKYDKTIDILHWIIPREIRAYGKQDRYNMPYESVWAEISKKHEILRSGYMDFPVATGRFYKKTGEKHGYAPSMDALADVKMINAEKKTVIRGAMKVVDPPMSIPNRGYMLPLNFNPAGINYRNPQTTAENKIEPVLTKGNILIGFDMIQDTKAAIEEDFFVPLFKAFSQITKQMTIPEVQRRIAENMVLLGPVVGRFTQEVLTPIIIRVFNILYRQGAFPPPPPIIQGQSWEVVYISQLAKMQRASEIISLERTLDTVGTMSQYVPEVLDKIDSDKAVDVISEINGINPEILRSDEEVQAIRQARLEAQQKMEQAAALEQTTKTIETASKADKNLKEVKK